MASDTIRKTITFPKKLAEKISELAKREGRSFSAQVIMMLKQESVSMARWMGSDMEEWRKKFKNE